jgi:hypothetical protein
MVWRTAEESGLRDRPTVRLSHRPIKLTHFLTPPFTLEIGF